MKLKYALFIISCIILCGCSKSYMEILITEESNSITGFVSDDLEHELQRAKMTLLSSEGVKEVTETGTDGRYEFQNLISGGSYTIVAELSGYYSDSIKTIVDKAGVRGDFILKEIALRLSKTAVDVSVNDYADFIIYNDSKREMVWSAEVAVNWLSLNKTSGIIKAKSAEPIHVTIDRNRIPENSSGSKIVLNSSHEYAELMVQLADTGNDLFVVLEAANIAVLKTDSGSGNWSSVNSMCENSITAGYHDWRLPTKDELMVLYNERDKIGGFFMSYYWSSSPAFDNQFYYIDFTDGEVDSGGTYNIMRCRCVRTLSNK